MVDIEARISYILSKHPSHLALFQVQALKVLKCRKGKREGGKTKEKKGESKEKKKERREARDK